jgi:hypothetical protein
VSIEWKLRGRIAFLGLALGHLESRVVHEQFPQYREVDTICLALILRQLLRTIEALNRRVQSQEVDAAVAEFYSKLPNEKLFRDVLEHFDEYQIGEGRLQKDQAKLGKRVDEYWIWYESDGMSYTLRLGSELRLDVTATGEAAYALSTAVREPFDKAFRRTKKSTP